MTEWLVARLRRTRPSSIHLAYAARHAVFDRRAGVRGLASTLASRIGGTGEVSRDKLRLLRRDDFLPSARARLRHVQNELSATLAELGRHRIAAIGAQLGKANPAAQFRLEGYRRGLGDHDLPVDDQLVVPTAELHRSDGAQAMVRLLDLPQRPDAVFCFNDLLALGALRILAERGIRVPDDVAIVGFDDIEDGRFSSPTLTTISPNKQLIAAVAVSLLLTRAEGDRDTPPQEIRADYRLIRRESTLGRGAVFHD